MINKTLSHCRLLRTKSAMIQHHIEILSSASSCNHPTEIPRNSLYSVEQARTRSSKFKSVVNATNVAKFNELYHMILYECIWRFAKVQVEEAN